MIEGLKVLDLTDESGWLSGKILGDLGADVIKVEPPGGDLAGRRGPYLGGVVDPERSLVWLALNTSKRGIQLDLARDRETLLRLVARSDVLLETFAPGQHASLGLDYAATSRLNPRLVHCSITPFGQTGPLANWRGGDLIAVAMGGNLAQTGDADRPPVRCSMPTAYYHGGAEAAIGVLAALYARDDTGRGQLVDVSLQETQLRSLLSGPGQVGSGGPLLRRTGPMMQRTREIWAAKDGNVSFGLRGGPARIPNLKATVAYMEECGMAPQWLREYDWDAYDYAKLSDAEIARLEGAFGAFFASRSMRELFTQALERRILLAPCNDAREIVEHVQLRDRHLFVRLDYPHLGASIEHPDFFAKVRSGRIALRRRAPRIGEHDAEVRRELEHAQAAPAATPSSTGNAPRSKNLFDGLRVLEIGSGAAGPVAASYLAEHGARVIRIESRERPDFLRTLAPHPKYGLEAAPMFILLNANKETVALNLKHPEGLRLAEELVKWADVVLENYAAGVLEKLGLGHERVRAINPRVVMASGCLFGQTGPQRHYPGFGGQGSAISGFNHLTGWPDGMGYGPAGTITDSLAPRYLASAILAALWRRRRTGEGESIDVSQIETAVYSLSEVVARFSANGEVQGRIGNHSEQCAPHSVYPARGDDRWIALACPTDTDWERLVGAMGRPDWARDARFATNDSRLANQTDLDARIGDWTRAFDAHELAARLQEAGVQAAPVQDANDLLADPQLAHRGHFVRLRHVNLGEMVFERAGMRFSDGSGELRAPGPTLGQHNKEILGGLLGLDDARIAELVAARATV
ncbi:MAG TPA: CoA transferase [Myxococcota bacterium]|nr:CoA transferase [Myxococcota bacterium]